MPDCSTRTWICVFPTRNLVGRGVDVAQPPRSNASKQARPATAGLFFIEPLQVGENEFWQVITITTFEQAAQWHAKVAQGFAQPMKVLSFEGALRQRIA